MRRGVRRSIVVLLVGLSASPLAGDDWPPWLERWLFNATERTERAVESFEEGDIVAAVEPLESALRLVGDDPRVQYNAGASRLAAGRADAQALLEAAAVAGGELAPLARYNLGNARMAGDDFPGAIEAYQQALRGDPDFEDAKYNLELAQRRLETQDQESQEEQEQEQEQEQAQDASGSGPEQQEQDASGSGQEEQDPQRQEPPEQTQDEEREPQQEQPPGQSPLPQFRDLPDMTAQEAAAILEAIENMEREDRRREAIEAAAQHRSGKKDW